MWSVILHDHHRIVACITTGSGRLSLSEAQDPQTQVIASIDQRIQTGAKLYVTVFEISITASDV